MKTQLSDCLSYRVMAISLCIFVFGSTSAAVGDIFKFKDGRVLFGTLEKTSTAEVDGAEVQILTIQIDSGVYIQILKSELTTTGHEPLSEPRKAYASMAAAAPRTLEAQVALAEKASSREFLLLDVVKAIREYCVDLAPNDSTVRSVAGYKLDNNGRWQTTKFIMAERRGMVRDGTRWVYPEELVIQQAKEERVRKIADATRDLRRWHATVTNRYTKTDSRRYQEAVQGLRNIQDPLTTEAIAKYLEDTELAEPLRLLYVDLLRRFRTPTAASALAQSVMKDPSDQVRNACLDALREYGRPIALATFVGYLGSPNNPDINRAAYAIAQIDGKVAVLPLIKALVTQHKVVQGGPGMNVGNGGLAMGQKETTENFENDEVLGALTTLTGRTFGFDKAVWLQWFAQTHAAPAGDLRRDS
ncbi:MAG: hypothetical protein Aurels2KO_03600 [Aureliella sp.]